MAEEAEKSALERIAEILVAHGVEFIIIGGQAEVLFGSARVTFDVDLCYRRSPDNFRRLAEALNTMHPCLRGAPSGLPFVMDEQTLALGCNFTLSTSLGDLDLLGYLDPVGDYSAIEPRAVTMDIGSLQLKVIHIDDLITIKKHIGRPRDQLSLYHLLAIKNLQHPPEGE